MTILHRKQVKRKFHETWNSPKKDSNTSEVLATIFLQKTRLILFFIFVICQLSFYIPPDQNIETQEI